jgi:CheY-like chemotaxis protein
MTEATTLLMAEDDPGHAALITRSLRNAGLDPAFRYFRDGQALLDHLLPPGSQPGPGPTARCVLLLDIRMPKVDGIEVLRRIRATPETAELPVIMLTTTDDPRDIAACRALGCLDYVVKSVRPDRFRESMARLAAAIRRATDGR